MTQPLSFAVIGHPVAHSRSPQIHAAFAKEFGIALTYDRIDAEPANFEHDVATFFNAGGRGLNVTVPFKERAWHMAQDHLSERARDAGAVNTLWVHDGQPHGCNTDGIGLVMDIKRLGMPLAGAHVLILGAGGAARGVIGPLLAADAAHITVINRTEARAHALIENWVSAHPKDHHRLQAGSFGQAPKLDRAELIINATSSSLQGDQLPLSDEVFEPTAGVYDMMYGQEPTAFMRQAQAAGCPNVADGLGMLVGQASESFYLWHGLRPNIEPVIAAIRLQLQAAVR